MKDDVVPLLMKTQAKLGVGGAGGIRIAMDANESRRDCDSSEK